MSIAIFTIVKNERFFLKLWYEYYCKHFDDGDIFILNHDSTDDSLEFLINTTDVNIIHIQNDTVFDHVWLRQQVENFQNELLKTYSTVVFAEVDEFIIPKKQTLRQYLTDFNLSEKKYVTCFGIELLHSRLHHDPNKLILEQKTQFRLNNRFMNKTLITKVPLIYAKGFHTHSMPDVVDRDLILLHLHYFDYIEFMNRAKARILFSEKFEKGVDGIQNKYKDLKEYEIDFWNNQNPDYYIDLPKVI